MENLFAIRETTVSSVGAPIFQVPIKLPIGIVEHGVTSGADLYEVVRVVSSPHVYREDVVSVFYRVRFPAVHPIYSGPTG